MDNETRNLTQRKAMGLAGYATQSVAAGNLYNALTALKQAVDLVNELIDVGEYRVSMERELRKIGCQFDHTETTEHLEEMMRVNNLGV